MSRAGSGVAACLAARNHCTDSICWELLYWEYCCTTSGSIFVLLWSAPYTHTSYSELLLMWNSAGAEKIKTLEGSYLVVSFEIISVLNLAKQENYLKLCKISTQDWVLCTNTSLSTFHSQQHLFWTEPRNEMLNMTYLMLASTATDFIQNKQQHADSLRTVAYNPKPAFLHKWPINTSIFTFLQNKMMKPDSPKTGWFPDVAQDTIQYWRQISQVWLISVCKYRMIFLSVTISWKFVWFSGSDTQVV